MTGNLKDFCVWLLKRGGRSLSEKGILSLQLLAFLWLNWIFCLGLISSAAWNETKTKVSAVERRGENYKVLVDELEKNIISKARQEMSVGSRTESESGKGISFRQPKSINFIQSFFSVFNASMKSRKKFLIAFHCFSSFIHRRISRKYYSDARRIMTHITREFYYCWQLENPHQSV